MTETEVNQEAMQPSIEQQPTYAPPQTGGSFEGGAVPISEEKSVVNPTDQLQSKPEEIKEETLIRFDATNIPRVEHEGTVFLELAGVYAQLNRTYRGLETLEATGLPIKPVKLNLPGRGAVRVPTPRWAISIADVESLVAYYQQASTTEGVQRVAKVRRSVKEETPITGRVNTSNRLEKLRVETIRSFIEELCRKYAFDFEKNLPDGPLRRMQHQIARRMLYAEYRKRRGVDLIELAGVESRRTKTLVEPIEVATNMNKLDELVALAYELFEETRQMVKLKG
jgi:hypothetical protein